MDPKYPCDTLGVVYKIECKTCSEEVDRASTERYVGMTRTSLHNRMRSHLKDQKSRKSSNPLWRHDKESHGGVHQSYVTSIIAKEKKLLRLNCLEALHIEKQPLPLSINARMEHGRGGVVRISATRTG